MTQYNIAAILRTPVILFGISDAMRQLLVH
jgi:hypothetical protein